MIRDKGSETMAAALFADLTSERPTKACSLTPPWPNVATVSTKAAG